MLTVDLVRVRQRAGKLVPRFLDRAAGERLLPVAAELCATTRAMVGRTRDELDAAHDALVVPARDRLAVLGLRKLVEDRSDYEVASPLDPETVRRELFLEAAAAHRALDVCGELDRDAVLASVASRLGASTADLEASLYADLRGSEVLRRFRPTAPEALLAAYDLSLAQAVLLRAVRVRIRLERETPMRVRRLFRAIRFHGLLHEVRADADGGYTIDVDGPLSLWGPVQRYGLRLALLLPTLVGGAAWRLSADVRWGPSQRTLALELGPEAGLVADEPDPPATLPDLEAFCEAFRRLESSWTVAPNDRIFALPGEVVCVPDLVFESRETGEQVFLEAFGFWSRTAVWQRIELLRKGFPARILLALGKELRVSEDVLGEGDAGEIYVYRSALSPRAVLERLGR